MAALIILATLAPPAPPATPPRCHWQKTTVVHPDDPLGYELTMRQWVCDRPKPNDDRK